MKKSNYLAGRKKVFKSSKKFTAEQMTSFINFISNNPHLRVSEIAERLNITSCSVWKIASDNDLKYSGKWERKTRKRKAKLVIDEENPLFDDSQLAY